MAYETELANISHQTDVIASIMTDEFSTVDNTFPLVLTQTFPDNTNVILFPKSGTLTAAGVSESGNWSYGSGSEITDTETTITGVKKEQAIKITLETMRFGGPFATIERFTRMAARSLARLAASELKTLFSSTTNSVTATSTLTKEDLLDARYNVVKSAKGAFSGRLVGWLDYKGMNELNKDLVAAAASAFSSQVDLGVLGVSRAGEPRGMLFDVALYETDGLPTSSSDDIGQVWDPALAFAAGIDGQNGFNVVMNPPTSQGGYWELLAYTFWHIAQHNDTAACKLLSDT